MIKAGMHPMQNTEALMHIDLSTHMQLKAQAASSSNNRILDIPCKVCGDFSSGKHYNIFACDGCAGFFKRSIRRNRQYMCKAKDEGLCVIDKAHRNQCRACRLKKCQNVGMNKDGKNSADAVDSKHSTSRKDFSNKAVQHERGPRNSTIRRQQMSFYGGEGRVMVQPPENVLNLTMPKYESSQPAMEHPVPLVPSANFLLNNLLPIPRVPMHFPPMFPPALINHQAICESAASLLFMNVQWIRNLPTFTSLPHCDQILLLGESWLDLFILGTAQFLPYINISLLAQAAGVFQASPSQKSETLLREVQAFQDILKKIAEFQLDPHEYSCLRAIVLFRTSFEPPRSSKSHKQKSLVEQSTVSDIQDDAQMRLNRHISTTYPKQPLRFGKILLLVSSAFRGLSEDTIEELFFKKAIQDTPLVAILGNMYNNNKFPTDGNPVI